jgi:hypothetical protein
MLAALIVMAVLLALVLVAHGFLLVKVNKMDAAYHSLVDEVNPVFHDISLRLDALETYDGIEWGPFGPMPKAEC